MLIIKIVNIAVWVKGHSIFYRGKNIWVLTYRYENPKAIQSWIATKVHTYDIKSSDGSSQHLENSLINNFHISSAEYSIERLQGEKKIWNYTKQTLKPYYFEPNWLRPSVSTTLKQENKIITTNNAHDRYNKEKQYVVKQ